MKKILCLIIVFLVITGCKNDNSVKEEIELSYKEKKSYYVSLVNKVSHDDYYKEINKTNEQSTKPDVVVQTNNSNETTYYSEQLEYENNSSGDSKATLENTSLNEEKKLQKNDDELLKEEKKEHVNQKVQNNVTSEEASIVIEGDVNDEELENEVLLENSIQNTTNSEHNNKSGYYSPSGKYLGEHNVKVIDVSYYQGNINWDLFANESDCYGVILRLGYYDTLDKKFERNINEIKRLGIPYGIYLFSYSTTLTGAKKEALFTNQMIDKYDLNPTLGIYYDIESWSSSNGSSSNEISKDMYDKIVSTYINEVSNYVNNNYKVKVYSGRWYAMNRLGKTSKSYVDWVAEYNSTCKYDGSYSMWQYTSKGSVPGIEGNVDISYIL